MHILATRRKGSELGKPYWNSRIWSVDILLSNLAQVRIKEHQIFAGVQSSSGPWGVRRTDCRLAIGRRVSPAIGGSCARSDSCALPVAALVPFLRRRCVDFRRDGCRCGEYFHRCTPP